MQTLVLDMGYQPVNLVPFTKALRYVVKGKVDVLENYDLPIHPDWQMPAVVRTHRQVFQVPSLAVVGNVRCMFKAVGDDRSKLPLAAVCKFQLPPANVQGPVAIGPGFKKKNSRQEVVFSQYPQDLVKRG